MNSLRAPATVALLLTFACSRQGFVAVTVNLGSLSGKVDRLALSAFDARGDAGPLLIPTDGPIVTGVSNNSLVAVTTPVGNSLTVLVAGLGADSGVLGIASATVPSASANTRVTVTLAPPCVSVRDCDPDSVCLGATDCVLGTCQPVTGPLAPAGAPCGPSDGGRCGGTGACLLPYCGTGLQPLPPGEECDEGVALNGSEPDHCRADCKLPSCGDGIVDPDAGELCDLGARNGTGVGCNGTCSLFGTVTVLAGNGSNASLDGIGLDAGFAEPGALAVVGNNLIVADQQSRLIRRIDLTTLEVTTLAGGFDGGAICQDHDGNGSQASFCFVSSLLAYGDGVIVGDSTALRLVRLDGGVSTFAGRFPDGGGVLAATSGTFSTCVFGQPFGLVFIPPIIYSSTALEGLIQASDVVMRRTWFAAAPFPAGQEISGLTALGSLLYAGNASTGAVAAVEPDAGTSIDLTLNSPLTNPRGLCSDGRAIYVADGTNVKELALAPGIDGGAASVAQVSLLAGGSGVNFLEPDACVYDPASHALYVSDLEANLVFAIH